MTIRSINFIRQQVIIVAVSCFMIDSSFALNCTSDPCMYGICLDNANSTYSCYCIDGYTGINCEINWDDCWSDPCLNGGTCSDAVAAYNCTCPDGFIGTNCEQKYSECLNQPCLNNGTCIDYNGFTCQCQEGYSGDYCEIDISVCNSTICKNSGECLDGPGYSFACKCKEGWTGELCEIDVDECLSSPCLNGGLCLNIPASYTCVCLFGFTGKDCDKPVISCDINPCYNDAMCLQEDGQSVCYCVPDYHGQLCESRYNDCESKFAMCDNGGTCVDGINAYTCSCPPSYGGPDCRDVIPFIPPQYTTQSSPISSTLITSTPAESTMTTFNVTQISEGRPVTSTVLLDRKSTTQSTSEFSTFDERTDRSVDGKTTVTDFTTKSSLDTLSTSTTFSTFSTVFQEYTHMPQITSTDTSNATVREPRTSTVENTFSSTPSSSTGFFGGITERRIDERTETGGTTVRSFEGNTSSTSIVLPDEGKGTSTVLSTLEGREGEEEIVTVMSSTKAVQSTTEAYSGEISTLIAEEEPITKSLTFNCTQADCNCTTLEGCTSLPSIKNAAFNGKSYIRQQVNLNNDGLLKIFLELKTKSENGIIMHVFFDEERYILLYTESGQLKFRFSCGLQTMLLGEIDTPINNGHNIDVEIRFHYSLEQELGTCRAKLFLNGTMAMSGEQMLSAREEIPRSVRLHLGGIPQPFSHYSPIALGFVGCMGLLRINDVQKHFIHDSLETFQIEECTSFLCLLNPCRNFGSCHDFDGRVYCKCIPGYSGEMCEKTACDDNPCYLGATCISSPGTGFICICPMGMHGLRCQEESTIVQPSFSVFIPGFSSYAAYGINTGIKDSMEFRMKILPHSVDQISLIAYMGQSAPGGDISDHFSITYVRGFIMLTWDLGSGVRRIFTKKPLSSKVHKPHLLNVGRRGRDAWLFVDGLGNFSGQAAGTMTQLDVSPVLYIGGHKSKNFATLPHDLPLHTGFTGCIFDVELMTDSGVFPVTKSSPATGRGVGECHRNECTRNTCKNGAVCLNHGPTYSCICMKEWEGPECSISSMPCSPSNPTCHKVNI